MSQAEPPYIVEAEQRAGYLRITMAGRRSTLAASIAGWREVGRLVQSHGAKRILVVSYMTGDLPSPEVQRDTMRALANSGFEGVKIAFVSHDVRNVAALEHGELEARDMGQASRVFGSEELAVLWLQHG